MRYTIPIQMLAALCLTLVVACDPGSAPTESASTNFNVVGRSGFGFNGTVSGFPHGVVRLTGGGSFDPSTASNIVPTKTSAHSGGGFDCVETVAQGPIAGCESGQGVRWDTSQLLESTSFKCTGSDVLKPIKTDAHTAVLLADFYRAGNGNIESFTAQIIVADHDIAPNIPGVQNLWVQGVGCGTANVNFN